MEALGRPSCYLIHPSWPVSGTRVLVFLYGLARPAAAAHHTSSAFTATGKELPRHAIRPWNFVVIWSAVKEGYRRSSLGVLWGRSGIAGVAVPHGRRLATDRPREDFSSLSLCRIHRTMKLCRKFQW